MKKYPAYFLTISMILFLIVQPLFAAPKLNLKVQVQGGKWTIKLDETDLVGGAGTDFVSPLESAADKVDIDITNPAGNWRMYIRRVDSVWNPNIRIYARRTTDGTGTGTISGGTNYQEITTSDVSFFSGTLDRTSIKVQLMVDFSVAVGINDFTTAITYTVTDS